MEDNKLYQEINKIKIRILIILIILFALSINIIVILPFMRNHIDYRIPDLNSAIEIQQIFLILGLAVYITYIYKFKQLSKNIKKYQKNLLGENRNQDFILIYKKYSKVKITESLFYIVAISIYTYLFVITIQML